MFEGSCGWLSWQGFSVLDLVEEYGGIHDDGAVATAALDAMALNTYVWIGPFKADWLRKYRACIPRLHWIRGSGGE